MQPKLVKKNGNISVNQDVVFQHMCSHYRRILNAKKIIDTSPPYCYKPRRLNSLTSKSCIRTETNKSLLNRNISPALTERSLSTNSCKGCWWETRSYTGTSRYHAGCVPEDMLIPAKHTCIDMDLVDRITYDTKNGPSAYCVDSWNDIKPRQNSIKYKSPYEPKKNRSRLNPKRLQPRCSNESHQKRKFTIEGKLTPSDLTSKKNQICSCYNTIGYPRILKTNAVSKLRSMRVYHPPRKRERVKNEVESEAPSGCFPENCSCTCNCTCSCKCRKICVCNSQERELDMEKTEENSKENQTSSRDSAYNGGVSSVSDSRSPTPDQRKKQEEDRKSDCQNESQKEKPSECCFESNSKGNGSQVENHVPQVPDPESEQKKEALTKMKEESLYVKFIQDITAEILEKNLYTNKALKQVMKNHMIANQDVLDENRMKREIEHLKKQLGIPEDHDTLNIQEKVLGSSSNILDLYPIISDSELEATNVKKKTFEITKRNYSTAKNTLENKENIAKSISDVISKNAEDNIDMDSDEENDEISVIQIARTLREKKRLKKIHRMPPKPSSSHKDSSEESNQSSSSSLVPNIKSGVLPTVMTFPEKDDNNAKNKGLIDIKSQGEESASKISSTNKPNLSVTTNLEKKSRSVSFWNTDEIEHETRERSSTKKVTLDYAALRKKEN